MSLSPRTPAARPTTRVRWILLLPLTVALVLAGLPAHADSGAKSALITGTVSFQEADPDRTIEVFREVDGSWVEDEALQTEAATDGSYEVHAPAGEPVKLRVSYGEYEYGYWYGDGFGEITALTVEVESGRTLTGIDLDVPAPAYVSGRVTNRAGVPMAAVVVPSINNDGGLRPLTDAPIDTSASGAYTVILPADHETGVMGLSHDGFAWAWLGGGSIAEPNFYINLTANERRNVEDLVLPLGSRTATPAPAPATVRRLTTTGAPVVHGPARKGRILRTSKGSWNLAPTGIRYQWLRNGAVIRGATKPAYRLTRADVRKRLSVRVVASRAGVRAAVALSARTARVKRH